MRRRDAERLVKARLKEWDPETEYNSVVITPDGTRGEWAAAVGVTDENGRRDPNVDLTVYVHKNGNVEGPY